jgi:hypothetical protein
MTSFSLVLKRFGVAQPDRRVFRCAAGYSRRHAFLTTKDKFRMCGASECSSSLAAYNQTVPYRLEGSATTTVHLSGTPGQILT